MLDFEKTELEEHHQEFEKITTAPMLVWTSGLSPTQKENAKSRIETALKAGLIKPAPAEPITIRPSKPEGYKAVPQDTPLKNMWRNMKMMNWDQVLRLSADQKEVLTVLLELIVEICSNPWSDRSKKLIRACQESTRGNINTELEKDTPIR